MVKDLKEAKKKATKDWQDTFPHLTRFSSGKFYKILGPLILGLELIKLPRIDDYRPYFTCYPLWEETVKLCLDKPIILKEFFDTKGLQFSIPYTKHSVLFPEASRAVKEQVPISFNGNITWKEVFNAIDEQSKSPPLGFNPNSYLQANLQKSKLEIALYTRNEELVHMVYTSIRDHPWDEQSFEQWDATCDKWLEALKIRLNQREKILLLIKSNQQNRRFEKLQRSELTQ